jgi:uncharacterized protein (TIGR04255 family)
MPDGFSVEHLEKVAGDILKATYPQVKRTFTFEQTFGFQPGKDPNMAAKQTLSGLQFQSADGIQTVQFRANGFSFHRLAPYTVLDDYLDEIIALWVTFCKLCNPSLVKMVSLRNINRIVTKLVDGKFDVEHYLRLCPRLPDEESLTFTGFLHTHQLLEPATGSLANVVLASQPIIDGVSSMVLDINAFRNVGHKPDSQEIWKIDLPLVRRLKDEVFKNTLSEECLKSYLPY